MSFSDERPGEEETYGLQTAFLSNLSKTWTKVRFPDSGRHHSLERS